MANPKISVYNMSVENSRYTFIHQDGYNIRPFLGTNDVEGTTKDIAYKLFDTYIHTSREGYTILGPFWVLTTPDEERPFEVGVDWLAAIKPEPSPEFWAELNSYFIRFMDLIIFS